jgi:uncharacterized alkaline shock family protein YloU
MEEVYRVKVRFWDRLLTALAGLLLFATGLVFFLWAFKGIPADWLNSLTVKEVGRLPIFVALGLGAVMVLLGIHSISLLFRRRGKKGFVVQKTEHGELSISIHAMENLVQKCIDKHEELTLVSNHIENTRDGVVVDLRIGLANGVSIPLVVSTLQKQIKQYITSCSGIDVKEVKVEVETASIKAEKSPYSVPDSLLQTPVKASPVEMQPAPRPVQTIERPVQQMERPAQPVDKAERSNRTERPERPELIERPERSVRSERSEKPERVERIERVVTPPVNGVQPAVNPVQQPAPQVMQRMQADLKGPSFPEPPVPPATYENNEEKKRPLHQRLFGHKEQPAIVPMPPELERKAEFADEPMMFDMQEDADSAHEALEAQEGEDHEEH